jgi:hypothetical protein
MKVARAVLLAAVIALLTISATAQAHVTLGQLAPGTNPMATCLGPDDLVQTTVGSAPRYDAPGAGVITSWSTNAGAGTGQEMTLKVYRPFQGNYLVVGHDGPRPLVPSRVNTFRTEIPVEAGDVLALSAASARLGSASACLFTTAAGSGDRVGQAGGAVPDRGTAVIGNTFVNSRLNLQATFLPPPVITGVGTTQGSVAGGTPVTISGANLDEVQSVTFAGAPAKSFVVDSEAQITAIAPRSRRLAAAAVAVTTLAGTATAPQSFTYLGCSVPKLKRKRLVAAKKSLKRAGCRVGKVRKLAGATAKKGRVAKQKPGPGTVLAPGAKVALTLR